MSAIANAPKKPQTVSTFSFVMGLYSKAGQAPGTLEPTRVELRSDLDRTKMYGEILGGGTYGVRTIGCNNTSNDFSIEANFISSVDQINITPWIGDLILSAPDYAEITTAKSMALTSGYAAKVFRVCVGMNVLSNKSDLKYNPALATDFTNAMGGVRNDLASSGKKVGTDEPWWFWIQPWVTGGCEQGDFDNMGGDSAVLFADLKTKGYLDGAGFATAKFNALTAADQMTDLDAQFDKTKVFKAITDRKDKNNLKTLVNYSDFIIVTMDTDNPAFQGANAGESVQKMLDAYYYIKNTLYPGKDAVLSLVLPSTVTASDETYQAAYLNEFLFKKGGIVDNWEAKYSHDEPYKSQWGEKEAHRGLFAGETPKKALSQLVGVESVVSPEVFQLKAYPNPVKDSAAISYTLSSNASSAKIRVTNVLGQTVSEQEVAGTPGAHVSSWSKGTLPAGIYMISLTVDGKVANQKVLVTK